MRFLALQGLFRRPISSTTPLPKEVTTKSWWLSDTAIAVVTAVIACLGISILAVLLAIASYADPHERPGLEIDAIKYGLGVIASGGAVAALLLAIRRQRLSERSYDLAMRAHSHTEMDATERRVTELYIKAVEQLGSADAAVRLGGLYALERVAHNNPEQRQTVVNVICAYLRMPFTPPPVQDLLNYGVPPCRRLETIGSTQPAVGGPVNSEVTGRDPQQELQVRMTAQEILARHLRRDTVTFWADISVDLTGATLVDFNLYEGTINAATFDRATFHGTANFTKVEFLDAARFYQADFLSFANFMESRFRSEAYFHYALFKGFAVFFGCAFEGEVSLQMVHFDSAFDLKHITVMHDQNHAKSFFTGTTVKIRKDHAQYPPNGWTLRERKDDSGLASIVPT